MDPVGEILALFGERGDDSYFGEAVTQTEHALQAAWLAARDSAAPALVVASLLHDAGHLLHRHGEDIAEQGVDARHERIGAGWLSRWFAPHITEPIRLHVAAKRYLCTVDVGYAAHLSDASRQSLRLQGGGFTTDEIDEFRQQEHWQVAVQLRRYDDAAKVPDLRVPSLETYRSLLRQSLR